MTKIIAEEQIIEAPQTFKVLPREFISTFKAADATPSVLNLTKFKAGNTGASNVTFFDDGFDGQEISVLGDGFTTLVFDATKLIPNSSPANKLLLANRVYRLTRYSIGPDKVWVEDA